MKNKNESVFYVSGPDWDVVVNVDVEVNEGEREQLLEAGTIAIERKLSVNKDADVNFGPILLVKKGKKTSREAMVNTYHCLTNAAKYNLAEDLRVNYKKDTGNDLALDEKGYSY